MKGSPFDHLPSTLRSDLGYSSLCTESMVFVRITVVILWYLCLLLQELHSLPQYKHLVKTIFSTSFGAQCYNVGPTERCLQCMLKIQTFYNRLPFIICATIISLSCSNGT